MLQQIRAGAALVVASRYVDAGSTATWNPLRKLESRVATKLAQWCVGAKLCDPMSGFFAMRSKDFMLMRDKLRAQGFKILLEIISNLKTQNVVEVPLRFRARRAGRSKMSGKVAIAYLAQLVRLARGNHVATTAKFSVAR